MIDDGYEWSDNRIYLGTLTRACRIKNDCVHTRLPIHCGLLEILLFEILRIYKNQPYLELLYKTIFVLSYYGLFRIGELTLSDHTVKAKDVHIAENKDKMMFVLYSSKTHGRNNWPQQIRITANRSESSWQRNRYFCPFRLSREYLAVRGNYANDTDPFFIFRNSSLVKPNQVHNVLHKAIKAVNLDPSFYNCHSFRIGRASNMVLKYHKTIDKVKMAGRWWSNVVFKYIRNL